MSCWNSLVTRKSRKALPPLAFAALLSSPAYSICRKQVPQVGFEPTLSAAVAQDVPDRDPVVRQQPRQIAVDRRVEFQLLLVDQLEQDDGGEGLGDAADTEPLGVAHRLLARAVRDADRGPLHRVPA